MFALFAPAFWLFYFLPNAYPLRDPAFLSLLGIDKQTPFVAWTFWIYTSDYLMGTIVVFLLKRRDHLDSYLHTCLGVVFLCGAVFFVFPTIYPRPEYPEINNLLLYFPMYFVGKVDQPTNCFPSMHVALTCVFAWGARHLGKRAHIFFWIWAVAIFISTLTTKQHYFVDILGGLVVAAIVIFLDPRLFGMGLFQKKIPGTKR